MGQNRVCPAVPAFQPPCPMGSHTRWLPGAMDQDTAIHIQAHRSCSTAKLIRARGRDQHKPHCPPQPTRAGYNPWGTLLDIQQGVGAAECPAALPTAPATVMLSLRTTARLTKRRKEREKAMYVPTCPLGRGSAHRSSLLPIKSQKAHVGLCISQVLRGSAHPAQGMLLLASPEEAAAARVDGEGEEKGKLRGENK